MRKYQQRQLLEIMRTINEANDIIKRFIKNKNNDAALKLLIDCHESAVNIGKTIEQLEGEGIVTVTYLEEYCDMLYQAGMIINEEQDFRRTYKLLHNQIIRIENSIRNDIKADRLEIVFLPYKASMWDTMESVWMVANNDSKCDVHVVPIPYFDVMGGKLGHMHYEGNLYPKYVPITDWQEYNIAARHPDIIYIHNPYDESNFVTRVHPDFFSNRLKNCTDMLVYIPYFVVLDNMPEEFCIFPGSVYADKVIVQSEEVKNTYIRVFDEFERKNNQIGLFGNYKNKFIALGSPKFDKVMETKREDCQLPESWERLIEQPEGGWKKIILYNTSINGILSGNEQYIKKIKYVLNCFKDRDDVILLWRPHPLNITTYASMRPQLLQEYLQIIENYKREGWGIYDDTADMNRAIAISDAYYGDWSSLVALYQCTGKPVFIQNINISNNEFDKITPAFENFHAHKDKIWFTAFDFNALFELDKKSGETKYLGSFPGEKRNGWRLYNSIVENENKLFFTPGSANEIAEYDITNNSFRKIKLNEPVNQNLVRYHPGFKFFASAKYKQWIFFVACSYPAIVRYDTESGLLDYYSDWIEPLNKLVIDPNEVYFRQAACVNGSTFAVTACNANAVMVFDMDTCTSKVYEVGSKGCSYSGICFDGKDYWMSPRHEGPILRWNPEMKIYKEYGDFPDGFQKTKYSFWNLCYGEGYIWLFPQMANMALKFNIEREIIEIAEEFQDECRHVKTDEEFLKENYIMAKALSDGIYAHTGKSNKFVVYNHKTNNLKVQPKKINTETAKMIAKMRSGIFNKNIEACNKSANCNFYENALSRLPEFIKYIGEYDNLTEAKALSKRQIKLANENINNLDGASGKAIHKYIKKVIK